MDKSRRFEKVIKYLKELHITQEEIAETLTQETGKVYDKSIINRLKNEKRNLSDEAITAMQKCYHINPRYLKNLSDIMLDNMEINYETFNSLFHEWTAKEANFYDKNGIYATQNFLHFTMDSNFYDFLTEIALLKTQWEDDSQYFDKKYQEYKDAHNEIKDIKCQEYVLIPADVFPHVIQTAINREKEIEKVQKLWAEI